ncbi:transglutaminase domain-containing protein [Chitinophaga sp. CF118]|uniref:transglutaminase domain-containing protein n=1 Tax=Chitinophaga sp. CF118 TaxID=1884367 RepID=UPI0015A7256E|nr:transglutaminase domain-containing protein [Chitinophaga sp. CF118]
MNKLLIIPLLILQITAYAQQEISSPTITKFSNTDFSVVQNAKDLSRTISVLTKEPKEQLQMLLLWADNFLQVDSDRFLTGGYPLTTDESIKQRKGLCDEYANIVTEFCKLNNIKCLHIEGYVKYAGFKPTDILDEANHAWNAVYIDSSWVLCDLFWSTCEMVNKNGSSYFIKKINTAYFLVAPAQFISTHLPLEPVFQFDNYPLRMQSFYTPNLTFDSSARMGYVNYLDSVNAYLKLNEQEQNIKIAENSYVFNKDNPNTKITTYYNYAVSIVNNKKATLPELKRARYFLNSAIDLIKHSSKPDIQNLLPACQRGIVMIDKDPRLVRK